MSGDYTRFTFKPRNRFSGVLLQQGRVQLDSDWNEEIDILKHRLRVQALDTFGPVGVPFLTTKDAFKVSVGKNTAGDLDILIEPGRLYVDGILVEAFKEDDPSFLHQPFWPGVTGTVQPSGAKIPPLPGGNVDVYLDVWEREVTYVENAALLDVALGGADTAARTQVVWQLRLLPVEVAACGAQIGEAASDGLLSTDAIKPPPPDDPCLLPPLAGYRGIENRLYRVEVHQGGALGTALFKWSRDNGSIVSPVTDIQVSGTKTTLTVKLIGRDQFLRIAKGNWVTVTDGARELRGEAGEMAFVDDIDEANNLIILDRAIPSGGGRAFGANATEIAARHTRVQRWDQNKDVNTLNADGLMTTGAGPIDIEDGITVSFATKSGGNFRVGDYWVFWARTATAEVEKLDKAPPRGIRHHYVQLAAINGLSADNPDVQDCRPKPEKCECSTCCLITVGKSENHHTDFGTIEEAVAALSKIANEQDYVIICLEPGKHEVTKPVKVTRPRTTIRGCGFGSQIIAQEGTALVFAGTEQVLEDVWVLGESAQPVVEVAGTLVRVQRCRIQNGASGPALASTKAKMFEVRDCEILGHGGLALGGREIDVVHNLVNGGPVLVRDHTMMVRIHDNRIVESAGDGITIGEKSLVLMVEIENNLIDGASGIGISSGTGEGATAIVLAVSIHENKIWSCDGRSYKWSPAQAPAGGIALRNVFEAFIERNDIRGNGQGAVAPVCGIWIGWGEGVVIRENDIQDNRPSADGAHLSVLQGGIHIELAMPELQSAEASAEKPLAVSILPAAEISDNFIDAPIGHAVYIVGEGAMMIRDNRLRSYGAMIGEFKTPGANAFQNVGRAFSSVYVVNLGLSTMWSLISQAWGFNSVAGKYNIVAGFAAQAVVAGGQVRFTGNQVRVDLHDPSSAFVPAHIGITTLDDSLIAHNQTEGLVMIGKSQLDVIFADVFALAGTSRQTDNGLFTPPIVTLISLLSGALFNHCLDNQAASCVIPLGGTVRNQNNVVIAPSIYCRPGAPG